jgi:hypothetical protein
MRPHPLNRSFLALTNIDGQHFLTQLTIQREVSIK